LLIQNQWDGLSRPSTKEKAGINENESEIILSPLERGYGQTLGNSLRRVLLSSIMGAAITGVRIEGVKHEFSSIQGVREDVIDILLNLKGVVIKMTTEGPKRLMLRSSQAGEVTAGMIKTVSGVEILNKRHVICHLNRDSTIEMELTVNAGRGYVPAEQNKPQETVVGFIPVDSIFSPVRRVSYNVQATRADQRLDHDRLNMKVETDGSIAPRDAVAFAARILQEYLNRLINFDEPEMIDVQPTEERPVFIRELLAKVEHLDLTVRSQNCLKNENIVYVGDLVQKSEQDMLRTPNFGRKSLNEIKETLSRMNLSLGMETPGWPPDDVEEQAKKFAKEQNS